jgi:hypothetical protein
MVTRCCRYGTLKMAWQVSARNRKRLSLNQIQPTNFIAVPLFL